jgi:hypothetical protein
MNIPVRKSSGFLLFSLANAWRTGDAYFLLVFGSERRPPRARFTHSFATFVHAQGDGPNVESYGLEAYTISWLPRSLDVRIPALLPEPGTNLGLHATLRHVLGLDEHVAQWGPFAIDPLLYERARSQVRRLTAGLVRYKAVDAGHPPARVANGIHAVSDLAGEDGRLRVSPPAFGEVASYLVARTLQPWVVNPGEVHPWVGVRLGLADYPIARRDLEDRPPRAA